MGLLYAATRKKERPKRKSRKGQACDPLQKPPHGYMCVAEGEGFVLEEEAEKFIGFGPYSSRQEVDHVLEKLGFSGGDLEGFERYMSQTTPWDLQIDGEPDKQSMLALAEAERLYDAGRWTPP